MSRHTRGDPVRIWKPGHAEHGLQAIVGTVMTIEAYYGDDFTPDIPAWRGLHAYTPANGWRDEHGEWFCGGPLPDALVVSEAAFLAWVPPAQR